MNDFGFRKGYKRGAMFRINKRTNNVYRRNEVAVMKGVHNKTQTRAGNLK